jgi:hypothetical protein
VITIIIGANENSGKIFQKVGYTLGTEDDIIQMM